MQIKFVEVQNFRKLKSCRIDFADETTLFVGANNSGKTSAMDALRKFLIEKKKFTTTDFTLSNWIEINRIGRKWEHDEIADGIFSSLIEDWEPFLPSMDVWLQIKDDEIRYVPHLIPTIDWEGGLLGVRLRLEPENLEEFYKKYRESRRTAKETLELAKTQHSEVDDSLELWPKNMREFLNRKLNTYFTIRAYALDPSKCQNPTEDGVAKPQILLSGSEIEGDPFKGLILINYISAQRGFSDPDITSNSDDIKSSKTRGTLSAQLRKYYDNHLNPDDYPDSLDIGALQAIESAQRSFNERLNEAFKDPISELNTLGYPGISDPQIKISTKIKPLDFLDHDSAVQFALMQEDHEFGDMSLSLPEQYNGLGYQNLISIVFELMKFRDEWMQVGKVAKKKKSLEENEEKFIQPLHLVFVEEPEAHLHVQVQQVFIRHAYKVLSNHEKLGDQSPFKTQMVVSTHSSHIAHGINNFGCLRYFRRMPALTNTEVPFSAVVNLSDVFGTECETERFVTRYLQTTHCDLFFADAAILVEGPAERMLIPHFIRKYYPRLNECYISLLEIGGSHAHRLRPLIEKLGLITLIITDLDSCDPENNDTAVPPSRNKGYKSGNSTLKTWVPCKDKIDDLLSLKNEDKVKEYNYFAVKVAYQSPTKLNLAEDSLEEEALSYTFEDALAFTNLTLFKVLDGKGLIKKFKNVINDKQTASELSAGFFKALKDAKKAEFALELLYLRDPHELNAPTYIHEGLVWLQIQLQRKSEDCLIQTNHSSNVTKGGTVDVKITSN